MNVELHGKLALVGGADGPLATAIRRALEENGALVAAIDVQGKAQPDATSPRQDDPFVLVLLGHGANGVPDADTGNGTERQDFARLTRRLAPRVKRVVMVFSSAGLFPIRGLDAFSADQAGLASLTRTLAMDLGPSVVVNAVAVGAYDDGNDVRTSRFLGHTGIKRPARLSEIVSAVLFLADPDNSYMTGHTLNIDGGWAAGYARNF